MGYPTSGDSPTEIDEGETLERTIETAKADAQNNGRTNGFDRQQKATTRIKQMLLCEL